MLFQPTGMGGWTFGMEGLRLVAGEIGVKDIPEFARLLSIMAAIIFRPAPHEGGE